MTISRFCVRFKWNLCRFENNRPQNCLGIQLFSAQTCLYLCTFIVTELSRTEKTCTCSSFLQRCPLYHKETQSVTFHLKLALYRDTFYCSFISNTCPLIWCTFLTYTYSQFHRLKVNFHFTKWFTLFRGLLVVVPVLIGMNSNDLQSLFFFQLFCNVLTDNISCFAKFDNHIITNVPIGLPLTVHRFVFGIIGRATSDYQLNVHSVVQGAEIM